MNKYKLGFRLLGKWSYTTTLCTEQQLITFFLKMAETGYDKMSIEVIERNIKE